MFMQDSTGEILSQSGTRRALPASDRRRRRHRAYDPSRPRHPIEFTKTVELCSNRKETANALHLTRQSLFVCEKSPGEGRRYFCVGGNSLIYGDSKSPVIILPVFVVNYHRLAFSSSSIIALKKNLIGSLRGVISEDRTILVVLIVIVIVIVIVTVFCTDIVLVAVITVHTLYAGTLVTCWTTAPSHQNRWSPPSALLAAFCLFLATLTIAARCYASSNATHQLVQLSSQQPLTPSSIDVNSNPDRPLPGFIVVSKSKLKKTPRSSRPVQSDTRVILTNSKELLYNQNFNSSSSSSSSLVVRRRTKRDFDSTGGNDSNEYHSKDSAVGERDVSETQSNEIPRYTTISNARTSKRPPQTTITDSGVLNLEKRSELLVTSVADVNSTSSSSSNSNSNSNNSEGGSASDLNVSNGKEQLQVVVDHHQNDFVADQRPFPESGTERPMPPLHGHDGNSSTVSEWGVLVLVVSAVVLTVALGLVTCVLSHHNRSSPDAGGTAADPHDAAQTPTTAPMLSVVSAGAAAGVGGMDRLRGGRSGAARDLAASRDRQVRLHTVHTDIAINLPPSISMPDGEEHPFHSRLHIRDSEQESEIYQKCIRPPPNRTVLESESPPPYRSSSAGLLGSISGSSSGSSDWSGGSAPLVVRCHSMSSSSMSKRPEAGTSGQKTDFLQRTVKIFTGKKSQPPSAPTLPVVIVPSSRPRRTSTEQPQQQQQTTARPKPSV